MADPSSDDLESQAKFKEAQLMNYATGCLQASALVEHAIDKILKRTEAILLINQIEQNSEKHAANLIASKRILKPFNADLSRLMRNSRLLNHLAKR